MLQPDVMALYLYDAVTLFMIYANDSLQAGIDYRDGRKALKALANKQYNGNNNHAIFVFLMKQIGGLLLNG